jgi:hypothetical protein
LQLVWWTNTSSTTNLVEITRNGARCILLCYITFTCGTHTLLATLVWQDLWWNFLITMRLQRPMFERKEQASSPMENSAWSQDWRGCFRGIILVALIAQ